VFFLVDPHVRVVSTETVPPQQREWLLRELHPLLACRLRGKAGPALARRITSFLGWPMGRDEAEEHRDGLMKERRFFLRDVSKAFSERGFNMCEH
jgi:hypothetical protein